MVLVNKEDDHNKAIAKTGNNNDDKTAIHIYAHGSQRSITDEAHKDKDGNSTKIKTKQDFINLVEGSNEKDQWDQRSESDPVVVVLHSCRTGRPITKDGKKVEGSIAEKLSKIPNTIFVAPDERDVFTDYFFFSSENGPTVYENTNENGDYEKFDKKNEPLKDKTNKMGSWRIYKDGKEIGKKPGDWSPNGQDILSEYGNK